MHNIERICKIEKAKRLNSNEIVVEGSFCVVSFIEVKGNLVKNVDNLFPNHKREKYSSIVCLSVFSVPRISRATLSVLPDISKQNSLKGFKKVINADSMVKR